MKITALIENNASAPCFAAEHGLSLYIETTDHRILFDMGQSDAFIRNAELLGIDLSRVDLAVLSHGHYDHGGGLNAFFAINSSAPVFVQPKAFGAYYHGTEKYIGLAPNLAENERLIFAKDEMEIRNGLTLYSCNRKERIHNLGSFGLTEKRESDFFADEFLHEQYLLITENSRRVLISGCSHKGILNLAHWFSPDVLIGGFHFSKLPLDATLIEYAKYLDRFNTDYYTCHCTGNEQFARMQTHMRRLHYLSAGESVYIK